jgi:hypothetical protein
MKPVGLSRGRGISLINDMSQVNYSEPMVVQVCVFVCVCVCVVKLTL